MTLFFDKHYPNKKVIFSFALLGTLISSIIVCLIVFVFTGFKQGWLEIFKLVLQASVVFGFIPALMTGIVISMFRLTKHTDWVHSKCSCIGFATTFIYISLLSFTLSLTGITISCFGLLSAFIVALVALPEAENV